MGGQCPKSFRTSYLHTKPDLTFSIYRVAQFGQSSRSCHRKAVEQILRYVKGTTAHGICYRPDAEGKDSTEVYRDCRWWTLR